MSDREQFVLAGPPAIMRPLLEILSADVEVSVMSTGGPGAEHERLTVAMDPARAHALSVALGDRLLVERDEPLQPF